MTPDKRAYIAAYAEAVLARHPLTILQMLELETMKHELRRAMGLTP
jgi:hypothetical protein